MKGPSVDRSYLVPVVLYHSYVGHDDGSEVRDLGADDPALLHALLEQQERWQRLHSVPLHDIL